MKHHIILHCLWIFLYAACSAPNANDPTSANPYAPSIATPKPTPPPPRPTITDTRFSYASSAGSETLPQALHSSHNDENTPKHIGIVDAGFSALQSQNPRNTSFLNTTLSSGSHGTKVATIILQNTNPATQLYVYEAGSASSSTAVFPSLDKYQAIYNQGARIFNNSFSTDPTNDLSHAKLLYGELGDYAQSRGAIFVFATGNEGRSNASDEASLPLLGGKDGARRGWIATTAIDMQGNFAADYANQLGRAKNWGIAALGTEFGSGGGERGTSFAAPRVSAAVSKVWEQFPWMDNHLVTQTILSSADDYGDRRNPTQGPRDDVGWGILNVERALKGPARFDTRLLLQGQTQVEVDFAYRDYTDTSKLTWSNDIAGDAGLRKLGSGTLYLAGTNIYHGDTHIENGAIVLTGGGISESSISIGSGGRLQANSTSSPTIAGRGLSNAGVFEVYGRGAEIYGDYTGSSGSRLYISPEAGLEVRGDLDLGGSRLILHIPAITSIQSSASRSLIQAYMIKNYNASYFSTADLHRYITINSLQFSSQEITIQYTRNSTAQVLEAASYANANTLNTAQNFDTLLHDIESHDISQEAPVYTAALGVLNAPDFTRAIDSLSGEIHASSQNLLIQQNLLLNAQLNQRIALMQGERESGLFMQGFGSRSKLAQKDYANAYVNLYGGLVGGDFRRGGTTVGLALLLGNARADFAQYAGSVETANRHISAYASQRFGYFYITARAGVGFIKNSVKREINTEQTQSAHNDTAYNLYGEVGTTIPISFVRLNAFTGVESDYLLRGAFRENHALGLVADKHAYYSNALSLGLRAAFEAGALRLSTALAHRHLLSPSGFGFEARSVGSDSVLKIQGIGQAQDITTLNLGGMLTMRQVLVDMQYNFSLQDFATSYNHAISLGLRYNY